MTNHSNDSAGHDERAVNDEAQRSYGDQPTYHQQSDETKPGAAQTQPDPGYREQDYGGERMYDPEETDLRDGTA